MNIDEVMRSDTHTREAIKSSSFISYINNVHPTTGEGTSNVACSQSGVTTKSVHSEKSLKHKKQEIIPCWYALRATYGRELKAYHYLISKGIIAFCPTINIVKKIKGKRRIVKESRLPNILFAYGTEDILKSFVYDNINLPYLRFYYEYIYTSHKADKVPLVVPKSQMESLKIICEADSQNTIMLTSTIQKFKSGQLVRVVDGPFCGVIGRVARYQGQQRVAVIVNDLLTVCTAYVPKAFLENV